MIITSLLTFLKNPLPKIPLGYYLYRVGKSGSALYVGRSLQPAKRLRRHVTITGLNEIGTLGKVIYCNLPDALAWQVKLYTLADCQAIVFAYYLSEVFSNPPDIRNELVVGYRRFANASPNEQYYNFSQHFIGFLADAEAALIWRYKPCVNIVLNEEQPPYPPSVRVPRHYFPRFLDPADARRLLKHYLAKAKSA